MSFPIRAAVLSLSLLSLAAGPAAFAQQTSANAADARLGATTLRLDAAGEVKAAPDLATISLAVSNQAPTAALAMQANAANMAKVVGTLRAAGIADRDIRTSELSLNPQYAYTPNEPPRLTGYQAVNQVTVTVRDLKRLGATTDAAVSAGANGVNGISFGLSDPSAAEDAARLAAVKALRAKAELYARATGYRIVRLVSLGEGASQAPRPPVPLMAMRAEAAQTPVSPGETTVRIEISGVYELAR